MGETIDVGKADSMKEHILITGGAGYVGSVLVPKLFNMGHQVTVLDLYLYGDDVFEAYRSYRGLREIKGDIRNRKLVQEAMRGIDVVIHLACISNDPSFELDPQLGKSINYDCFAPLVRAAKSAGVKRFIYASSSSVYGVRDEKNVTEGLPLTPLTDYSKYKAMCEDILMQERGPGFTTTILRPATVCGYAPRLRLDLTVNILTAHALQKGYITVFGGSQKRPNIHIEDMSDVYVRCISCHPALIDGKIFNVGYENYTVMQLAHIVRDRVDPNLEIRIEPTDDLRSYHICSSKVAQELGFSPRHTIRDAVDGLVQAFRSGFVDDPLQNTRYYNIKTMQGVQLK
jgi:nucleoside-diphosphate-sugar epimerase